LGIGTGVAIYLPAGVEKIKLTPGGDPETTNNTYKILINATTVLLKSAGHSLHPDLFAVTLFQGYIA
jgi:hypothetical protein